jgi:ABC-type multidrug transport system ATPase subunit
MLSITLDNTGKKYGREWIFRKLCVELAPGSRTVILGGNGSGKSTLLQVIAGYITPNEGNVSYSIAGNTIEKDLIYQYISLASPYLQLTEDFTGLETVTHLEKFKKFRNGLTPVQVLDRCYLSGAANKLVKQYSSGMKQRLKLALAIFADTSLVLLDEPASNLDKNAIDWYQETIGQHSAGRTVVVCSNAVEPEFSFCDRWLRMEDYKPEIR